MMHPSLLAWIGGIGMVVWGVLYGADVVVLMGLALAVAGVAQMARKSARKLNRLDRGMALSEVKALLGIPDQKELKGDRTVYKYHVFALGAGWKPVYLTFGADDRLSETFVDQGEYEREADRWLKALEEDRRRQELAERRRGS